MVQEGYFFFRLQSLRNGRDIHKLFSALEQKTYDGDAMVFVSQNAITRARPI